MALGDESATAGAFARVSERALPAKRIQLCQILNHVNCGDKARQISQVRPVMHPMLADTIAAYDKKLAKSTFAFGLIYQKRYQVSSRCVHSLFLFVDYVLIYTQHRPTKKTYSATRRTASSSTRSWTFWANECHSRTSPSEYREQNMLAFDAFDRDSIVFTFLFVSDEDFAAAWTRSTTTAACSRCTRRSSSPSSCSTCRPCCRTRTRTSRSSRSRSTSATIASPSSSRTRTRPSRPR